MLQKEFEEMIGKEVEGTTYDMYERMYMVSGLSKQEFVKTLNVEAIPESERAIKAREESKRITDGWKAEIEEHKANIENLKKDIAWEKTMEDWSRENGYKDDTDFYKRLQKNKNEEIRCERSKIKELKWLLSM